MKALYGKAVFTVEANRRPVAYKIRSLQITFELSWVHARSLNKSVFSTVTAFLARAQPVHKQTMNVYTIAWSGCPVTETNNSCYLRWQNIGNFNYKYKSTLLNWAKATKPVSNFDTSCCYHTLLFWIKLYKVSFVKQLLMCCLPLIDIDGFQILAALITSHKQLCLERYLSLPKLRSPLPYPPAFILEEQKTVYL